MSIEPQGKVPPATGLKRLFLAFGYSMRGLRITWKDEAAFRQEVVLSLVLVPGAFLVGNDVIEILLLISGPVLVMVAELLNSAIEAEVDRTGTDYHPLAAKAKDAGSASVFVALCWSTLCWVMIGGKNFIW